MYLGLHSKRDAGPMVLSGGVKVDRLPNGTYPLPVH